MRVLIKQTYPLTPKHCLSFQLTEPCVTQGCQQPSGYCFVLSVWLLIHIYLFKDGVHAAKASFNLAR